MIELTDVGMSFSGRALFRDVSLTLPQGSFHFVTGPSGAGKTTLMKLCNLEILPSEGRLQIFEKDTARLSRDDIAKTRRRIGLVHQDCRFIDHLSLYDNVILPLTVSGQRVVEDDVSALLDWVGLAALRDHRPPELSGGERQRAALARAVIVSPDIVLADEPTGNVDWDMSLRLLDLLIELNHLGKTVLCATHDMNLIRQAKSRLAARVLRISGGQIALAGAEL